MSLRYALAAVVAVVLSVNVAARADDDAKTETIQASQVPAKVMEAFKRDFPAATIGEIEKETYKDGTVHYEFEFKDKDGKEHEVEYNTDGEKLDDHDDDDDKKKTEKQGEHKH